MKYDKFDRALLRAGREAQAPTSRMRARALRAATAAGVATVTTTTTAAAAKAGAVAKSAKLVLAIKLTLVALATASVGTAVYARHVGTTERSVDVAPLVLAPPSLPERVVLASPSVLPAPSLPPPPVVVASAEPPAVITPQKAPAAPRASGVREELDLVDPARQALANGDSAAAIRLTDEHTRRFPAGVFAVERDVIRIDALERAGRLAEATTRAREFLAQHPHAPQARRIEKLLDTNP